jgi:hypothetical protein
LHGPDDLPLRELLSKDSEYLFCKREIEPIR